MQVRLRNKELSWLSFNARLLQEAQDASVPLLERLRFLGIFSNNLDEFFRVRVATLKRLARLGKKAKALIGHDPNKVLEKLAATVLEQQSSFESIYAGIVGELQTEGIFIVDEKGLDSDQTQYVHEYFETHVRPTLTPIMLDQVPSFPDLKDHAIYLAICLWTGKKAKPQTHALIEVPTDVLPRFVQLPGVDGKRPIILLDDVIRCNLADIFGVLRVTRAEAYTIKLTRDAEIDIENDVLESFMRKVSKGLEKRKSGVPVRFVYDSEMPAETKQFLVTKLRLDQGESDFISGGRYHNFKDFMAFPDAGRPDLLYEPHVPVRHPDLANGQGLLKAIQTRDILLHVPYQSFDHIIDLLREAAIDPTVTSIRITLYRVARRSNIVNALINAARNGKSVTAVVELQARFDEEANIRWTDELQSHGVRVLHGVPGLKVHSKLILITRKTGKKMTRFASIGTGNFHEGTAMVYTDHMLLTADPRLTDDVQKVFDFFDSNYQKHTYRRLLLCPFNARRRLRTLISNEIKNAVKGKEAYIIVKTNNFTDPSFAKLLYKASQAGVGVELMIRGMFTPVIGVKGMSEDIRATGTVDRFLEHTRIFVFCNAGAPKIYLSSFDWMTRNLDGRVEVACPVLDPRLQAELLSYLDLHRQDNVKARLLTRQLANDYRLPTGEPRVRAQTAIKDWLSAPTPDEQQVETKLRVVEAS